ncbi:transposase [Roseiconus nitratireducens]|uniref:Transposase n=1 Tax=Roseiconus nitratireducens TaxID=2605748 RepID=A0A5M6D980_9BACT|nr:transposase [Roseiconus nitratireducens]KAA5543186.1 transposase [Roseiconus nitratireducens]
MTRTRYRFGEDFQPHFLTCTVVAWLPVFSSPDFANTLLSSWRFLQTERGIRLLAWVILENHVHWIAVGPKLRQRAAEFKSFTATRIIQQMERKGYRTLLQELHFVKLRHRNAQRHQLWQEGFHPKVMESVQVLSQKVEYIHNNPLRRGFVDDPLHWRYSSARAYAGLESLLDVEIDWH